MNEKQTDLHRLAEKIVSKIHVKRTKEFDCDAGCYAEIEPIESLLREAMKHTHCISCHEDHDEGYAPCNESYPDCCCEGRRAEDQRVKEAVSTAYTRAAEVARQWGKENDALFGDEIAAAIERLREETK